MKQSFLSMTTKFLAVLGCDIPDVRLILKNKAASTKAVILTALLSIGFGAQLHASDFTDSIKSLMTKHEEKLATASQELTNNLDERASFETRGSPDVAGLQQQFETAKSKTDTHVKRKSEALLKLRFLTLLSAQTSISNGTARENLPKLLASLADRDLSASIESSSISELSEFEINLSVAIKNSMEPTESPATFIDEYMNWSSISEPKSPIEFVTQTRAYRGSTNTPLPAPLIK